MKRLWLIFAQAVTVCLAVLFLVTTLRPQWLLGTGPVSVSRAVDSYALAVARAAPSVVNVYTRKHVDIPLLPIPPNPALQQLLLNLPGFTQRRDSTSLGSGVIVRADGYILTNYHVIEAADAIEIRLQDGRQATARLVGADQANDLAVLKIGLTQLPTIVFDPSHSVRVGDVVLAIGNPFGVGQTVTQGIVSALGRNSRDAASHEGFIQTDAAINPGNSGGALIDTQGRLVGINTAIYSATGGSLGIGFAIPSGPAHQIMEQLIRRQ